MNLPKKNPKRLNDPDEEEYSLDYMNIGTVSAITMWSDTDKIREDIKDKRIYGFVRPKAKSDEDN